MSYLPPVVCRRAHVLFTIFVFVCVRWCPTHIVLCFCFVFIRLVCPALSIFDSPSVFSNVCLQEVFIGGRFHDKIVEQYQVYPLCSVAI
jgi:hypothetical protein